MSEKLHMVTGAFSFTGRYIARRLLERGERVKTLTNHPERNHPFGDAIPTFSLDFHQPQRLQSAMEGASTLFNTYWIRFQRDGQTYERAIENTAVLLEAARQAGVRRVVHFSIVNAAKDSPLPYFRAKATTEEVVRESGLSFAILRPTILFGEESVLFNNIAWLLRRFPVFAMAGKGEYRLQPVAVEDVAEQAIAVGDSGEPLVRDIAGPEIFTFAELIQRVAQAIGCRTLLLKVNPDRMLEIIDQVSGLVDDPVITREELEGLTREMLLSSTEPTGHTRLSEWLENHGEKLGRHYASAPKRYFH